MWAIVQGDARNIPLADGTVQACITSPPFFGLRQYSGVAPTLWPAVTYAPMAGLEPVTVAEATCCLGLEPEPSMYVAHLVAIFREVWRVCRQDAVVFVNLGDSYASGKGTCFNPGGGERSLGKVRKEAGAHPLDRGNKSELTAMGLKPKDLIGIPWRVALALQADGWYLRSDIIWSKPNPMPESVEDRPSKAHEYIFLLAKSADYYWDQEAVREPNSPETQQYFERYQPEVKTITERTLELRASGKGMGATRVGAKTRAQVTALLNPAGRNIRSVWTQATQPCPLAHFAVWPSALVAKMIAAGTSEKGCCPKCHAPYERIVDKERSFESGSGKAGHLPHGKNGDGLQGGGETLDVRRGPTIHSTTLGWRPSCSCYDWDHCAVCGKPMDGYAHTWGDRLDCGHNICDDCLLEGGALDHHCDMAPVPCLVLDPFSGAGTTIMQADRMGRDAIGLDLSLEYCVMARERIIGDAPLLAWAERR